MEQKYDNDAFPANDALPGDGIPDGAVNNGTADDTVPAQDTIQPEEGPSGGQALSDDISGPEEPSSCPARVKKNRWVRPAALAVCAALTVCAVLAVFRWYYSRTSSRIPDNALRNYLASFAALALFAAVLAIALPRFFDLFSGKPGRYGSVVPFAEKRRDTVKKFIIITLLALVFHVFAVVVGNSMFARIWELSDPMVIWRNAWMKLNTDAGHYLTIARDGYVVSGDDKLLLVFFPFFPMLIRFFDTVLCDGFVTAMVINAAATALVSGMTFLTMRDIMSEKCAAAAAFLILLLPGAIFMNSPMSEPVFMLLTVCAFYFMHRGRYIAAGLFIALSGLTRSLGAVAALPLALFGLGRIACLIRAKEKWGNTALKLAAGLALSTLGTFAYLYINWRLYDHPLQFLRYQADHWSQRSAPFFDTPRYILDYFLVNMKNDPERMVLWLPQLITIYGSLIVMCFRSRRLAAPYTAYFLGYFAVAIGCTWLLSSVRYMAACLPLTAALGTFCNKPWKTAVVFLLAGAAYFLYMYCYMKRMGVY